MAPTLEAVNPVEPTGGTTETDPWRRSSAAALPTEEIPVQRTRIEIPDIVPATTDLGEPIEAETGVEPTIVAAPQRVVRPQRAARRRVRTVTRVVRHLDPWSVFKVALMFSVVAYLVALTSGVMLWNVALATGTIDNVERWFTQFGWESFELDGGEIYHNAWIGGLFAAVAATGGAVLAATIFNLVSDIVGGIRVTVLEDDVVERPGGPAERRAG